MNMTATVSRRSLSDLLFFTVLFAGCLAMAFHLNFPNGKARNEGVFASDKSIYYVYLPATFIYGWDVKKFPSRCDTLYKGFILDYKTGKIVNKMTCGVALMWTPFFLATHAVATVFDLKADGFSDPYQKMAIVPPVLFLILGLFFLKRFLENYFRPVIVYACILLMLAGTNLCYYGLAEGLMSHVHSFFLFSLYLFLLKKFLEKREPSFRLFAGICLVVSLAILVRPTNLIILAWFFMLDAGSLKHILSRVRLIARPKFLLAFLVICFLVFLPQFVYWKYLSGSFFHYSYGSERFLYWKNPVILPLWFSPLNGLFLYNPLVLFFVAGFIWMIFRRKANGILLLLTFALVTWYSGSWHMWYFGGSFGSRPFVEYYAIFSLGFCSILAATWRVKNLFIRSLLILLMIAFSCYNLRLTYYNYWNNSSVWAWDDFKNRLDKAGILYFSRDSYTYINDFENKSDQPALEITNARSHSRNLSGLVDSRYQYCRILNRNMSGVLDHDLGRITVSLWVSPVWPDSTNAFLVASIEDEKYHPWNYKIVPVNHFRTKSGTWSEVALSFTVPPWLNDPSYWLKIYLWNVDRKTFYIDDIRVKFE